MSAAFGEQTIYPFAKSEQGLSALRRRVLSAKVSHNCGEGAVKDPEKQNGACIKAPFLARSAGHRIKKACQKG
jgi:hypothetical protein